MTLQQANILFFKPSCLTFRQPCRFTVTVKDISEKFSILNQNQNFINPRGKSHIPGALFLIKSINRDEIWKNGE